VQPSRVMPVHPAQVVLPAAAVRAPKTYLAGGTSGTISLAEDGTQRWGYGHAARLLRWLCTAAGVPAEVTAHSFRHAHVTQALGMGGHCGTSRTRWATPTGVLPAAMTAAAGTWTAPPMAAWLPRYSAEPRRLNRRSLISARVQPSDEYALNGTSKGRRLSHWAPAERDASAGGSDATQTLGVTKAASASSDNSGQRSSCDTSPNWTRN